MKTKTNRNLILIAGMIIQLCSGIIYMWSVFKTPVANHFNWEETKATLTSSIMLVAFVVGIVGGGKAQDKLDTRKVSAFGSILIGVGMILTALVPKDLPWLIYLTYSVIAGLGVGIVYTTTINVIQKWFPDKRGFATGMMIGAFGFSLVLFAPITKSLLKNKGVPFTFLFFGISFLVICVLCSLFIKNPTEKMKDSTSRIKAMDQKQYTTSEMLKTKQFYLIFFSMLLILPAYFILNPIITSLGTERGLSEEAALFGVMLTGIASASGRIIFSWVSDSIGRKATLIVITAFTILGALGTAFATGYLFLACVAVVAFAFGGSSSVYPSLTADCFGTKYAGLNYGMVMIAFGFSALFFPMLSNVLYKISEMHLWSFFIAAIVPVISLVLLIILKSPKAFKAETKK